MPYFIRKNPLSTDDRTKPAKDCQHTQYLGQVLLIDGISLFVATGFYWRYGHFRTENLSMRLQSSIPGTSPDFCPRYRL